MTVSLTLRTAAFLGCAAACLIGAAAGQPLVGPAAVAVTLVAHVWTLEHPAQQLRPLFVLAVAGTAAESAWIAAGLYAPAGAMRGTALCPLWVTALWINGVVFAQGVLLPRMSLRPAPIVGAVAVPAGYVAADATGAILIAWPLVVALGTLAVYGAVALRLIMGLLAMAQARANLNVLQSSHGERRA